MTRNLWIVLAICLTFSGQLLAVISKKLDPEGDFEELEAFTNRATKSNTESKDLIDFSDSKTEVSEKPSEKYPVTGCNSFSGYHQFYKTTQDIINFNPFGRIVVGDSCFAIPSLIKPKNAIEIKMEFLQGTAVEDRSQAIDLIIKCFEQNGKGKRLSFCKSGSDSFVDTAEYLIAFPDFEKNGIDAAALYKSGFAVFVSGSESPEIWMIWPRSYEVIDKEKSNRWIQTLYNQLFMFAIEQNEGNYPMRSDMLAKHFESMPKSFAFYPQMSFTEKSQTKAFDLYSTTYNEPSKKTFKKTSKDTCNETYNGTSNGTSNETCKKPYEENYGWFCC